MSDRDPDDPAERAGEAVDPDVTEPPEPDGVESPETDAPDDGWEWEYTLEDIEKREAEAEAVEAAEERRSEPVEAGSPSLEGIVFVLLGVLFTVFILWRLVAG